jgi:mannitol 2-dehydrogenase
MKRRVPLPFNFASYESGLMNEPTITNTDAPPPVPLSLDRLGDLPARIGTPDYDRAALSAGIIHIGLGNFHRAHQAWYLHKLMQQGLAQDWALIGAGVRAYDSAMRDKLKAQDYLTTLIELAPGRVTAEVVGSMIDYTPIAEDNAPLIAAMADPAIRIVSLTVTEGGDHCSAQAAARCGPRSVYRPKLRQPARQWHRHAPGRRDPRPPK